MNHRLVGLGLLWLVLTTGLFAQTFLEKQIEAFCFGGFPSAELDDVYARNGYVLAFDGENRVPRWIAYKLRPDFFIRPHRSGSWMRFQADPDIPNEARDRDFKGVFQSHGLARGHLFPYFAAGGDRYEDGRYASVGTSRSPADRAVDDPYDAQTVYEANYMSNVAPQIHFGFNSGNGTWYALESYLRNQLVGGLGHTAWIYAGTIFTQTSTDALETSDGLGPISIPHAFWKIITFVEDGETHVLAFLLPHKVRATEDLSDLLVPISTIEALTGLRFFPEIDTIDRHRSTLRTWRALHPETLD